MARHRGPHPPTTEILHVGTFAGHIGHRLSRPLWWKGYRPRVRSLGESPKGTKRQLEEAYARATVAITRARSLCLIMGPLDMKGLLGAATVMGTLMYGAGHVWEGQAHFYLHDGELSSAPPDETFIRMLRQNCSLTGPHFPPPAIVEALQDYVTHYHKVRRLHLIVVDLWRPWKYNTARAKAITDQLW